MRSLDSLSQKELTVKQQLEVNIRILTRANFLQQFEKAVTVANKSIELARKHNIDSMAACFYEQLGNSYYYMNNQPKAIEQYKKGLEIAEKNSELWETASASSNNMAAAYIDLKDYENGEIYLLKSLNRMIANGRENDPNTHITQRLLATLYSKTNRTKEAEAMYLQFIEKGRKNKDTMLLYNNLLFYSRLLSERHDSLKAVEMSAEAIEYMRKASDVHSLMAGLAFHSDNLAKAGKPREAYDLLTEANSLIKKTYAEDLNKKISEVEVKYKTAEIRRDKELAEERARKQKQTYIISFTAILLLLGGLAFFLNQKRNARQKIAAQQQRFEAMVEGEEKERSRIAKDLHDGIVQDLTAIRLKLQGKSGDAVSLSDVGEQVDRAARDVRDIAYQMMPLALKEFGLVRAMEDLLQKMLAQNNIQYEFESVALDERLPEKIELCLY
ncbi:MAG: tetratricopeptide repeat protein, partial [Bacteroidia bacterium]